MLLFAYTSQWKQSERFRTMFGIFKKTGRKGRHRIIAACLIICMISGMMAGCSAGIQNDPSAPAVSGAEDDTHREVENGSGTDSADNGGNKDEGNVTGEDKSGTPTPTEEPESSEEFNKPDFVPGS